jgi:hypothetical protein
MVFRGFVTKVGFAKQHLQILILIVPQVACLEYGHGNALVA